MSAITAQLSQTIEDRTSVARSSTQNALDAMGVLESERAITNGVRGQLAAIVKDLEGIDEKYKRLLQLAHEAYGPGAVE